MSLPILLSVILACSPTAGTQLTAPADSPEDPTSNSEPPSAPADLSAVPASESEVIGSFSPTSEDHDGFRIYRSAGEGQQQQQLELTADDTTFTDSDGITPGKAYTYVVRAYNSAGESQPSNSVVIEIEDETPPPQQPQNQDALLTGMTPSNLTVPEGWTLQAKDDFEASPAGAVKAKGRIVSSRSHTGSHSVSAQISGDGHETKVQYGPIDSREVYVSWWEYLSPETRFNDETFFARLVKHTPQGFGEVILDYFGTGSTGWNSTDAFVLFNEQATIPMGDHAAWDTYKLFTRPVGRWVQYEWHFRANTPGSSDGYAAFYRDGEQIIEATNVNWSGETDMKGMEVEVSYLYTRHNWFEDYPGNPDFDTENQVCSGGIGHGQAVAESDGTQSHRQWSFGEGKGVCDPPSSSGRTGEIQPTAPIHRVWHDDIIVLRR